MLSSIVLIRLSQHDYLLMSTICFISAVKKSLSSLSYSSSTGNDPGLLGNYLELVVHINREGFVVFVNRHFCVFFAHRRDPEFYSNLRLTLPVLDDNGNEEKAVYHKVWWGVSDPSLPFDEIPASVIALASTYVHDSFVLQCPILPFLTLIYFNLRTIVPHSIFGRLTLPTYRITCQ